jgi:hypothetical protein
MTLVGGVHLARVMQPPAGCRELEPGRHGGMPPAPGTQPHCPWTNGKAERFNRTLAYEWAYSRPFASNDERAALLPSWLEHYNLERPHLGIGGRPPISRVNNPAGQYN